MADLLVRSHVESARFGRTVARALLGGGNSATAVRAVLDEFILSDVDLAIVRYPAAWVGAFHGMASWPGVMAVHADTLLYFEWVDRGEAVSVELGIVGREALDERSVADAVAVTFAGYQNHYAANATLDSVAIANGYAEWATTLFSDARNPVVGVQVQGALAAIAAIDRSSGTWDVALAGVLPDYRGRGVYRSLVSAVMLQARAVGESAVRISTQAHNVTVVRVWESLGWRLVDSRCTVHLMHRTT